MDWILIAMIAVIALLVAMGVVWLSNNIGFFKDLIG